MASVSLRALAGWLACYLFGLLNLLLYLGIAMRRGTFFEKNTEQDELQLAIARDQFWNLSKAPLPGFRHGFYRLRNGRRLHFICNREHPSRDSLVILLHGFPDSSMLWRHLMREPGMPVEDTTLVCLDMPGYGGSDSFTRYDTEVLEALTEFIVAMREKYIRDDAEATSTFVVAHDWGCVLAFRLAAEAPSLADRFILTNGPHFHLLSSNKDRIIASAAKIFRQFRSAPKRNFACLGKSLKILRPLAVQAMLMGYIFVFHLPKFLVAYLGTGGNRSFLRGVHRAEHERGSPEYEVQPCLAASLGPGPDECQTATTGSAVDEGGDTYGTTVLSRARSPGHAFWHMTGYYRDGVASRPWAKSLATIADLHALQCAASESSSPGRRRSSISSTSLFADQRPGCLKAPAVVLWGEKDQACTRALCLDGLGDYLAKDSEVTILPRTGHWTPTERESRKALAFLVDRFAGGRETDPPSKVTAEVQAVYADAVMMVKK